MPAESELASILKELEAILSRFDNYRVAQVDAMSFRRLVLEADDIIEKELGVANGIRFAFRNSANEALQNSHGGPSFGGVENTVAALRAACNAIGRKPATPKGPGQLAAHYVAASRLAEIRDAPDHRWDLTRLEQLCNELNVAHANNCYMSVGMLVRAITDHIPPVFGCKDFSDVANNLKSERSFKKSMLHLNNSLRNIADNILHVQIRQRESLPAESQVDFRADLDRLLEEVVRRISAQ